jgi:hypothetical protein
VDGNKVLKTVGFELGYSEGSKVGWVEGSIVGIVVGLKDFLMDGVDVGLMVGNMLNWNDDDNSTYMDEFSVETSVGSEVGLSEVRVGLIEICDTSVRWTISE